MVSLDAGGAGLTVGTMSLIRKQALLDAGGWAEWCLTEDSELAIRIHAAGYGSVYLTEPYGRGLVPETFEVYRRQRFRWTFGPVQEFRRHWRQFLPTWLGGRPNRLTARQKLHHANHGVDIIGIGLRMLTLVLGAAAGISMSVHYEHVPMPVELFISSTSALVGSLTMRLLVYRRAVGANLAQTLGGIVAFAALSLVITIASIRATVGLSSAWHRTNKFRVNSNWQNALAAATGETSAALACIATSIALFVWSPSGIVVMLAIALLAQAITFLAAPLLALIADQDLRTTSVAMRPKQAVAEAIGTPR
jgi:cellulose synthase/poly-beta-1,6-N-acetylglucosamine synthase-like glycosyltransferase